MIHPQPRKKKRGRRGNNKKRRIYDANKERKVSSAEAERENYVNEQEEIDRLFVSMIIHP